jgi:hypothetical protein
VAAWPELTKVDHHPAPAYVTDVRGGSVGSTSCSSCSTSCSSGGDGGSDEGVESPDDLTEQLAKEPAPADVEAWLTGALSVNDGDPEDGEVDLQEDDADEETLDIEERGLRVVQPKDLPVILAKLKTLSSQAPEATRVRLIGSETTAKSLDFQDETTRSIVAMKADPNWEKKQKKKKYQKENGGVGKKKTPKEANKPKVPQALKQRMMLSKKPKAKAKVKKGGKRKASGNNDGKKKGKRFKSG